MDVGEHGVLGAFSKVKNGCLSGAKGEGGTLGLSDLQPLKRQSLSSVVHYLRFWRGDLCGFPFKNSPGLSTWMIFSTSVFFMHIDAGISAYVAEHIKVRYFDLLFSS